jgi:cephalosporin hydroxylase
MTRDDDAAMNTAGLPKILFDGPELPFFCREVDRIKNGVIVEIGTHLGGTAAYGASIARNNGSHYHCIDPWDIPRWSDQSHYESFIKSMTELGLLDSITVYRTDSVSASHRFKNASVDLIFIDSDHRYAAVRNDINAWWDKLKPGGVMIGHDYCVFEDYGVIEAVKEMFGNPDEVSPGRSAIWKVTKRSCVSASTSTPPDSSDFSTR